MEQITINDERLTVYPNPTTEWLIVNGKWLIGNTIEVYDLVGRVVYSAVITPSQGGKGDVSINVKSLQSGIYFLKATDAQGNVKNGKFVKQ